MRVVFPLVLNGAQIQYPDEKRFFSNVDANITDGVVHADYTGTIKLEPAPAEPDWGQLVSRLELYRLLGQVKVAAIIQTAKSDAVVETFIEFLRAADGCYLKHPETSQAFDYLESLAILTAEEKSRLQEGNSL